MLKLTVIRKNKKNSYDLAFSNVVKELWKIPNRTIIPSYSRRIIYLRIFNKLYISRFVVGDLDCYS